MNTCQAHAPSPLGRASGVERQHRVPTATRPPDPRRVGVYTVRTSLIVANVCAWLLAVARTRGRL